MPINTDGMSMEELQALVAKLESNSAKNSQLGIKIGRKGGVSIYNLQRFPVTLYAEQWTKLFAAKDTIEKFLDDNAKAIAERVANPLPEPEAKQLEA